MEEEVEEEVEEGSPEASKGQTNAKHAWKPRSSNFKEDEEEE